MFQALFHKCLSTTNKVIVVSNRNKGEYIEGSMRNQSKAGELPKEREKVSVHTALRFSFAPDWLKNWCEFSRPITKRRKVKLMYSSSGHYSTSSFLCYLLSDIALLFRSIFIACILRTSSHKISSFLLDSLHFKNKPGHRTCRKGLKMWTRLKMWTTLPIFFFFLIIIIKMTASKVGF